MGDLRTREEPEHSRGGLWGGKLEHGGGGWLANTQVKEGGEILRTILGRQNIKYFPSKEWTLSLLQYIRSEINSF